MGYAAFCTMPASQRPVGWGTALGKKTMGKHVTQNRVKQKLVATSVPDSDAPCVPRYRQGSACFIFYTSKQERNKLPAISREPYQSIVQKECF